MNETSKDRLLEILVNLREIMYEEMKCLDEESFSKTILVWHEVVEELKDAVFNKANRDSRIDFEEGWGAQSVQFVIDCIPELHRVMKENYKRSNHLSLLDVGAGSGAGSNIFTILHSGRHIYSKLSIDAIDYTDSRLRWVKAMYPKVNYKVADIYDLPEKNWDIVFCSHVIEHVPKPRKFLEKLVDICKGFLLVYSPFNEIDKIPGHRNTITEDLYEGLNIYRLNIIKSMAWHADIPDDMCLLAVIDCRH